MHIIKMILFIALAMAATLTRASDWTLNKIDHPVLNELMVRNIYVDPNKRIYLSTDSGIYRYANKRLTKLDDRFNGSGKAYNGPISGIRPFDDRHLVISTFPFMYIFFDIIKDEYVEQPFIELMGDASFSPLYSSVDENRTVLKVKKNDGYYTFDYISKSLSFIHPISNDTETHIYQRSKNSPTHIVDVVNITKNGSEIVDTPQYEVKVYSRSSKRLKIITTFLSRTQHHRGIYYDSKFVLFSEFTQRIFENQQLIQSQTTPILCDVPSSNYNLRDSEIFFSYSIKKGDSSVILFSACGLHEYNIFTTELRFLYQAPAKEIGRWYIGSSSSVDNIGLLITNTDIYIIDNERFEKISAPSLSSKTGTVFAVAKIDDDQFLVADGTPGLKVVTNKVSKFQFLEEADLMRLTGGNSLRHVIKDENEDLWLSSQTNGLVLASFQTDQWFKKAHFLENTHVRSLFRFEQEIWVATEGAGLWVVDTVTMQISLIDRLRGYYGALNFLQLKSEGQYTEQVLISTTEGVLLYDLKTKRLVKKLDGLISAVWAMVQDTKGYLWIGSHNTGLHRLDTNFEIVETYSVDELYDSVPLDITLDNFDEPVLATWGAGVLYRKEGAKSFSRLGSQEGLLNDTVQSILRDDNGDYWISTYLGLARFSLCHADNCDQKIINFTRADGLPTNLFDLNSAHKNSDGSLIFGGFFGLVWFDPTNDIVKNSRLPKIHSIDSLYVDGTNNTNQIVNGEGTESIDLPYGVGDIRLRFTSDDYISENHKQYRYKINNNNWIQSNTPEIVMLFPSFGSYLIEASSSNSSGLWSDDNLKIAINITPPFWASMYAFVVYALLLVLLIFSFYRIKSLRLRRLNESLQRSVVIKTKALAEKNIELERSIKQQERMFENASHDLKTPISIISSCHELITNKKVPEHVEHHVRLAMKHSERLKDIVNRILVRERNKLFGASTDTDIIQVIRTEINDRENLARAKTLSITHNILKDQVCFVAVSESSLVTIVGNLLDNAIKYSPPKGAKVKVDISHSDDNVTLRIIDQGKGIEDISQFGQRYYRESDSFEGSGIGVASALELANNYKGNICANNIPEGGLEVILTLPQVKLTGHALNSFQTAESTKADIKPTGHLAQDTEALNIKPRVWYVEDEIDVIEIFKKHCADKINIVHATDGQQAIELLKRTPMAKLPDLILSDVMMPNMDGYNLCAWLKNSEDFQHIPTVLLTAKSDSPSQTKGLVLGADDYIDKFVSPTQIIQKIINMVSTIKAKERRLRKFVTSSNDEQQTIDIEIENPLVTITQNELNANFSKSNYTLGDLCLALHKSESTVARRLLQHFGQGFSELLFETRMNHAEKLLAGHLQIGEVAARCGFENSAYFSKRFKERYVITPSAFRQAIKPVL